MQKSAVAAWGAAVLSVLGVAFVPASAAEIASPWVARHNSKLRLLAGNLPRSGSTSQIVAAVEIKLSEGWKTYWRMPGDAGGVPPIFNWAGSTNLATAKVLYPAPQRLRDATGDTVGYKGGVVFPIPLTAKDPAQPIDLRLALEYGICREICVPVEATLSLLIAPDKVAGTLPSAIAAALDAVPRAAEARRKTDPELLRATAALLGQRPGFVLEAAFPGGTAGADLFVEIPNGPYVGLPRRVRKAESVLRFEMDLAQEISPEELAGKTLLVTMVSDGGVSEMTWKVE